MATTRGSFTYTSILTTATSAQDLDVSAHSILNVTAQTPGTTMDLKIYVYGANKTPAQTRTYQTDTAKKNPQVLQLPIVGIDKVSIEVTNNDASTQTITVQYSAA